MNTPELRQYGYIVTQTLSKDIYSGCETYIARDYDDQKYIVKALTTAATFGKGSCQRHLLNQQAILQLLTEYPNIPKFKDCFHIHETNYWVEHYLPGQSLASFNHLSPVVVKIVALKMLEILHSLHTRPRLPVYHYNINPEVVLYDARFQETYLIDFRFSSTYDLNQQTDNIFPGYLESQVPPPLRETGAETDLYKLGITLLCKLLGVNWYKLSLLTQKGLRSQIIFTQLTWRINPAFQHWLERMLIPVADGGFYSAIEAFESLETISVCDDQNCKQSLSP